MLRFLGDQLGHRGTLVKPHLATPSLSSFVGRHDRHLLRREGLTLRGSMSLQWNAILLRAASGQAGYSRSSDFNGPRRSYRDNSDRDTSPTTNGNPPFRGQPDRKLDSEAPFRKRRPVDRWEAGKTGNVGNSPQEGPAGSSAERRGLYGPKRVSTENSWGERKLNGDYSGAWRDQGRGERRGFYGQTTEGRTSGVGRSSVGQWPGPAEEGPSRLFRQSGQWSSDQRANREMEPGQKIVEALGSFDLETDRESKDGTSQARAAWAKARQTQSLRTSSSGAKEEHRQRQLPSGAWSSTDAASREDEVVYGQPRDFIGGANRISAEGAEEEEEVDIVERFLTEKDKKKVRKGKKTKRRGVSDSLEQDDDGDFKDDVYLARQREKKLKKQQKKKEIVLDGSLTVKELASKAGLTAGKVIRSLALLGEKASANTLIESDIGQLVLQEHGFSTSVVERQDVQPTKVPVDTSAFSPRPPVVTVMGHVDHGKTTLLDTLRKAHVAQTEHGGITQNITAFNVPLGTEGPANRVVFIDTPGHRAFASMRERGCEVTDIIVLVVAAEDGIMPQTLEVIKLAQKNQVPLVVAVNKLDRYVDDRERQKAIESVIDGLALHGVQAESAGGTVQVIGISAKTGFGVQELVEAIALQAEIMELRADADAHGEAVVLEAEKDVGLGIVCDVLVKWGTFRENSAIVCGTHHGRIRLLTGADGAHLEAAGPATPVRIIGLKGIPNVGETLHQVESDEVARRIVRNRERSMIMKEEDAQRHLLQDRAQEEAEKKAKEEAEERDYIRLLKIAKTAPPEERRRLIQSLPSKKRRNAMRLALKDHDATVRRERAEDRELYGDIDKDDATEDGDKDEEGDQMDSSDEEEEEEEDPLAILDEDDGLDEIENEDDDTQVSGPKPVPAIVKAEVKGALSAIEAELQYIPDDEVKLKVIKTGIGAITSSDIELAQLAGATIFGLNVEAPADVLRLARNDGVQIRCHDVIYRVMEDIREVLSDNLPTAMEVNILGRAKVQELFKINAKRRQTHTIAGCKVEHGSVKKGSKFRVIRNGDVIYECDGATSLRHFKEMVPEVKKGHECGIHLNDYVDYRQGDIIECYEVKVIRRKLPEERYYHNSSSWANQEEMYS